MDLAMYPTMKCVTEGRQGIFASQFSEVIMRAPEVRRVAAGGVEFAFEAVGEGVPLVAIHGFSPDRRLMIGCLEPCFDDDGRVRIPPSAGAARPEGGLSVRSYQRLYPDLPFMGESSDPASIRDSDGMLAAVKAFIEAMVPEGPFLLAGESYGGYLTRGLARLFRERVAGMLLIAPLVIARAADRTRPELRALQIQAGYAEGEPEDWRADFEAVAVVRDRYCYQRTAAEIIPGLRAARSKSLDPIQQGGYRFSFDDLGALRPDGGEPLGREPFDPIFDRPALFVLGRQDASTGWRDALRLADRFSHASYAVLDVAGHNVQIEQAGLFGALVAEWLGRCESANP